MTLFEGYLRSSYDGGRYQLFCTGDPLFGGVEKRAVVGENASMYVSAQENKKRVRKETMRSRCLYCSHHHSPESGGYIKKVTIVG